MKTAVNTEFVVQQWADFTNVFFPLQQKRLLTSVSDLLSIHSLVP